MNFPRVVTFIDKEAQTKKHSTKQLQIFTVAEIDTETIHNLLKNNVSL
ncbi:unnamed protein product [Spodoptera exigua]|nr:unnamed protein product [Spodoptera exigua]